MACRSRILGRNSEYDEINEAEFYLAALGYSLALSAASAAGSDDATAQEAAAAAARADAGARLARLAQSGDFFLCRGCQIGRLDRVDYIWSASRFNFAGAAYRLANTARDHYFELAA